MRLTVAQARNTELGGMLFARALAEADERTFTLGLAEQVGVIERAIVDAEFGAEHFAAAAREVRWEHVAGEDDTVGLDQA